MKFLNTPPTSNNISYISNEEYIMIGLFVLGLIVVLYILELTDDNK